THHDDVGNLAPFGRHNRAIWRATLREIAEPVARGHKLREDLFGGEVTNELLRAAMAERAGERAADLARDAERAASLLGNINGFDLDRAPSAPRRKAEQPLTGAVVRNLLFDH